MTRRHTLLWRSAAILFLTGVLVGCGTSTPTVTEAPPPPVTISEVVVRKVIPQDTFDGRIAAAEKVEVRSRARGELIKVNFEDGQIIKPGHLLYEIDPRTYQAAVEAAEAQREAATTGREYAKSEYARVRKLVPKGAASREELETWYAKQLVARAEEKKALAAIEEAKLNLSFTKITAPGKDHKPPLLWKVSRTQVDEGNLVNAGGGDQLLTTLVSLDPMYVYFNVDERSLMNYRRSYEKEHKAGTRRPPVKDLKIPVYVGLEGEEGYPHRGVLDYADNQINPSTGTIEVRGVLDNSRRIFDDGMRARVRIPISEPHKALLITERAIASDQGQKYVYVVNKDNIVERRDVTLGPLIDGLQVVTEGLKPGEFVIVNGILRVRDGMKVEPHRTAMPGAGKPAEATSKTPKK
jgi:multidrug efflux system membrane fusion protein